MANPDLRCPGIASAQLDGVDVDARAIALTEDGAIHEVRLVLGERASAAPGARTQDGHTMAG